MQKQAYEIRCGRAVLLEREGARTVCLKTERIGKEYIHHYLVPLHPAAGPGSLSLIYIDPEEILTELDIEVVFEAGGAGSAEAPDPGHAFQTEKGAFIKVHEDPLAQKTFAYVDMETGALCRRQERGVNAVFTSWRACVAGNGGDDTIELSVACAKFLDE